MRTQHNVGLRGDGATATAAALANHFSLIYVPGSSCVGDTSIYLPTQQFIQLLTNILVDRVENAILFQGWETLLLSEVILSLKENKLISRVTSQTLREVIFKTLLQCKRIF